MADLMNPLRPAAIKRQAAGVLVPPPDALQEAKAGAVARAAGGAPPAPKTTPPKAPAPDPRFPTQGPALVSPDAPKPPAPGVPAIGSPVAPTAARDAFALRREAVQAEEVQNEAVRRKAIERALTARGIEDSGILDAQQRTSDVDTRKEAGGQLNALNVEEMNQKAALDEAERQRQYQGGQNAQDRAVTLRGQDISKEVSTAGLAQAKELAYAGMDIQKASLALQEKGMNAEDAYRTAALGQAKFLAEKGLGLEEIKIQLQSKGMEQDEAYRYAALTQAKSLAEQGLNIEQVRAKLQEKGMDQQNAQFYASQAFEKDMFNLDTKTSVQKAVFADMLAKLDPNSGDYKTKLNGIIEMFFGPNSGIIANPPVTGNPVSQGNPNPSTSSIVDTSNTPGAQKSIGNYMTEKGVTSLYQDETGKKYILVPDGKGGLRRVYV